MPRFQWSFLLPKYWGTWATFLILWIVHWLPRRTVMKIGCWLGDQMRKRNKKRRHIVEVNLGLCFPDKTHLEREQMLIDHYRVFGATLIDMGTIWWASSKRLESIVKCSDTKRYLEIVQANSVILVSPHIMGLEASGIAVSRLHPMVVTMKAQKNPLLTLKMHQSRTRFNGSRILMRDQGLRHLISGIRDGYVVCYLPDEDFGDAKYTTFAPFFGVQTSTLTTLGRLCRLGRAKAVPCMTWLDIETGIYTFEFANPMENMPSSDEVEEARNMNAALEAMITIAPEQYMWTFKWFKTRPNDEPSPYEAPLDFQRFEEP